MKTRCKIGGLPLDVRNELNRRIQEGETGTSLVKWLNGIARVKELLADHFDGRPINEQNLSDWKAGGYQDWLAQEELREQARQLHENTGEYAKASDVFTMVEDLTTVLALRYAAVLTEWQGEDSEEIDRKLKRLRRLSVHLLAMRRSNQQSIRLEMEQVEFREKVNDRIRASRDDEKTASYEPVLGRLRNVWAAEWRRDDPKEANAYDEERAYWRVKNREEDQKERKKCEPHGRTEGRRMKEEQPRIQEDGNVQQPRATNVGHPEGAKRSKKCERQGRVGGGRMNAEPAKAEGTAEAVLMETEAAQELERAENNGNQGESRQIKEGKKE